MDFMRYALGALCLAMSRDGAFRSGQLGNEDEVDRLFEHCGCLYMLGLADGRVLCQWVFEMTGRLLRLPGGR